MYQKPFINKIRSSIFIGFMVFVGIYFAFRVFDFASGPKILISSPINGQKIDTETFLVEGNIRNAKNIYLNGREIVINENGDFKEILIAKSPYTLIVISAFDKYGKSKEKILEIAKN